VTRTVQQSPSRTVLLVEPWFAGSHQAWAEGLAAASRHAIELLTHEPSGWRDTFDHSAGRLAAQVRHRPEAVLASSMMDLGAFLDDAGLGDVPTMLYMHENQLTYDPVRPDVHRGRVNWQSARRAAAVAFNSRFHRDDFHAALSLLDVDAGTAADHRETSCVIPVGVRVQDFAGPEIRDGGPLTLVWNHRWEYDKDPAGFLDALEALSDLEFRLILLGEGAGTSRHLARFNERFGDRIVHVGYAPRAVYATLLRRSDIVVSAARQEFFGVSIVEALAAGAVPVVPNRLAYPEVVGDELTGYLYQENGLAAALRRAMTDRPQLERLRGAAQHAAAQFNWPTVAERYDALIDSIV
jgi:glycosyltransferase involved in cell wall biosynthesis